MDMRPHDEAALRAVQNQQKPPATNKPWRGNSGTAAAPPPPPKVYRVEPREFRDLVQRLTGAPPAAAASRHHHQTVAPVPVRATTSGAGDSRHHQQQQQLYTSAAPWFSFPMDAHHGNGALM